MMGGDGDAMGGLSPAGIDFSNDTQAMDFLGAMLDDTVFQVVGNAYARYFWYGTVVVVGLAALYNIVWTATYRMRLRAAAAKRLSPARPSNVFTNSIASITAVARESTYLQYTPIRSAFWFRIPPVGTILLLLAYLGFILALEFINNDVSGAQYWTGLGVRAAWLAVAQVPLLILLAGKNNLIGCVTGISYERLNVLHRWVSRVLLLLATPHFGYQSYGWNKYGIMQLEWNTDDCPPTGIAAYAILLWMNLSTFAPIRNWHYEFFVVQHILTFFGFIVAVVYHIPSTATYARVYIYIPIAFYIIDRMMRSMRWISNNSKPGRATLETIGDGVTKVRVHSSRITKWRPGAHVLLSIPSFGKAQSHPATIVSTPSSHGNDLVFILKGHKGFTKRIYESSSPATSTTSLLAQDEKTLSSSVSKDHLALIDGPYGGAPADFAAFDTVVLFAGSTGVTFTLPILLNLAERARKHALPVRAVTFVWVIKTRASTAWIAEELQSAFKALHAAGIDVAVKLFVTCDDSLTDAVPKRAGCKCAVADGPCCCTRMAPASSDVDDISSINSAEKTLATRTPCAGQLGNRNQQLSFASLQAGRPNVDALLWQALDAADGETGVAVCGPLGLSTAVRRSVVSISDERGVHKGSGAQGVFLHVEGFAW